MKKQGLLKTVPECEYPAEFLVARLRGKKGALFRNWEFLITSSDAVEGLQNTPFYPYLKKYAAPGIWRFLQYEYRWVYVRMDNRLRTHFESYFTYHEINTLLTCLRSLSSRQENDPVMQKLHSSLLHNDIQQILTGSLAFAPLLQALELRLCAYADCFRGLQEQFGEKGMGGLDVFIRNCFFASIFSQKQPAMMKIFFQYLVDFHNCLLLAKILRWQIAAEPTMIPGGTIPLERFKRAFFSKDLSPVLKILSLKEIKTVDSTPQKLETCLLNFITGKLRSLSFQRTVHGEILFYLWEQYRYSRNISMLLNTIVLDDEPVRESIVA